MTIVEGRATGPVAARPYWLTVVLLMLLVGLGHFNRIGMAVAGTERIIPEYGITPDRMGVVYSAFLLCYTLAMLPAGWLIDSYGPRATLGLFCFGSALFVALTGTTGWLGDATATWFGLLVVRSLMGIVNAPLHPSSANVVFECVPGNARSFANGLVTFGACIGIASTYHLFGGLMSLVGWPQAFLLTSVLTLTVGGIWILATRQFNNGRPPLEPRTVAARFRDLRAMLVNRKVVAITLSYAALGYFQYLYFYWIEYYFQTIEKQGDEVARNYSSLIVLAMGVGMVIGGWLSDAAFRLPWPRWRRIIVPVSGLFLSGAALEIGLLSSSSQAMFAACFVSAALLGACEGAFWTTVVELGGTNRGAAAGLMNMGGNAGGTLSPVLTPHMSDLFAAQFNAQFGWKLSLALAGAVAMLGAAFWFLIELPEEKEPVTIGG